jgi:hypothetical protein
VLGPRGMTWLGAVVWLLILITAAWPAAAMAASPALFVGANWPGSVLAASAQSPMEAQMLGERPTTRSQPLTPQSYLREICPDLGAGGQETTLQLPQNFRVSFRYNSDKPAGKIEGLAKTPLLFKYSMDYCLLPSLKVGLNGFLYQPPADHLSFLRQKSDLIMGWGTSLNYDLGRWSFTFQSQVDVDKSRPEEGKDIQSWFRVWYAF